MSGLANTTMAYLVVKTLVLAWVVVEVTVARQNLRVGVTIRICAKSNRIMNLSNKSPSMETI